MKSAGLPHGALAASGDGVLPPNLIGELLKHVERLRREVLAPHEFDSAGLSPREIQVLRLMSEGLDTIEIAGELCCSEHTGKNISYRPNLATVRTPWSTPYWPA
jgi:DNA-binding NarL/FixJ family response regulator